MPCYLSLLNSYQCEQVERLYKLHDINIPYKYGQKALLCDTTCEFQEFYECILDYIKVANIAEKTMLKYEHYFYNQKINIWRLWSDLNNMI